MHTRAFLEEYINKPKGKDGLKYYYRQYDRIAKVLIVKNKLDSYSQSRLFIINLPEKVKNKVLSK
jgi:predicted patatin/cPLA2 family phospholipase